MPGTVRNCVNGHFSIGAYMIEGFKVIIGAIYGPSNNSDLIASRMYGSFSEELTELALRVGSPIIIIGGDFNIKLDNLHSSKPRAVNLMYDIINQYDLIDAGREHGSLPTWRRPHLPGSCSRLD